MKYLNEYLNEGLLTYHRSPNHFSKFDMSKIKSDPNRQRYGYGLYFSDNIPHTQYGDYLYKVNIFKNKTRPVLIDTKKSVDEKIVKKMIKALNDKNFNSDEVSEFAYNGWLFYKTLSRILGGDKNASLFLFSNGIDGLKNEISRNSNDYILFSDDFIDIEEITT